MLFPIDHALRSLAALLPLLAAQCASGPASTDDTGEAPAMQIESASDAAHGEGDAAATPGPVANESLAAAPDASSEPDATPAPDTSPDAPAPAARCVVDTLRAITVPADTLSGVLPAGAPGTRTAHTYALRLDAPSRVQVGDVRLTRVELRLADCATGARVRRAPRRLDDYTARDLDGTFAAGDYTLTVEGEPGSTYDEPLRVSPAPATAACRTAPDLVADATTSLELDTSTGGAPVAACAPAARWQSFVRVTVPPSSRAVVTLRAGIGLDRAETLHLRVLDTCDATTCLEQQTLRPSPVGNTFELPLSNANAAAARTFLVALDTPETDLHIRLTARTEAL